MATVIEEVLIDAPPDTVWAAIADFGAVHERLAPGFFIGCRLDGNGRRIVTFFNGAVAEERLVGIDHDARRICYSVVDSPVGFAHHNASAQVFMAGPRTSRFVWTTDVLPDGAAVRVRELMQIGISAIKARIEAQVDAADVGEVLGS